MRTVYWHDESIILIDQTALPKRFEQIKVTTIERLARAIYLLEVRGAPAIGVSAAFGLALAARQSAAKDQTGLFLDIQTAHDMLAKTRPTATNLFWALNYMMKFANEHKNDWQYLPDLLLDEAQRMADEDVSINERMAVYGAELIADKAVIMTHCNCGPLCAVDIGTAMAPVIYAHQQGKRVHVYTDETRPLLQGARLNVWELAEAGVPYTLITDNTAAWIMQTRHVDMVMIGVDRVAANGDMAAKIGVYGLAVLAKHHGIPFYAVSPLSTIDMSLLTGKEIPIETRNPDEVRKVMGNYITLSDANVENYAFDITPNELITGIVTEYGICKPPYTESFQRVFEKLEAV
jgi:methylthioribose-1-phosphate isomerase